MTESGHSSVKMMTIIIIIIIIIIIMINVAFVLFVRSNRRKDTRISFRIRLPCKTLLYRIQATSPEGPSSLSPASQYLYQEQF
jgi:flagellar basal body-associated protein FliL